jgi:hypothetical protein
MGVQLNIKDERSVQLARELADANGTSMTQAVRAALELATAQRETDIQARIAAFKALIADIRQHQPPAWKGKTSKQS